MYEVNMYEVNQDLTAVVPKEQCYCHVIIMALCV